MNIRDVKGRPVGIVTDRDIVVRAVAEGDLSRPVREIVSGNVVTARPDMSTREAATLMGECQVRRLTAAAQATRPPGAPAAQSG